MAAAPTQFAYVLVCPSPHHGTTLRFLPQFPCSKRTALYTYSGNPRFSLGSVSCSAANKPSPSADISHLRGAESGIERAAKKVTGKDNRMNEMVSVGDVAKAVIQASSSGHLLRHMSNYASLYNVLMKASGLSSSAKIRSEVLSPFRSLRMFFYLAFVASGALGGFIAATQLIGALTNPSRAAEVSDTLKNLGIDIGAVSLFAFLYIRENKAKNAQVARLVREECLSRLKVRIDEKRIIPVSSLRGIARLVILAGPGSFIKESYKLSEPYTEGLLDRAVLVVPFATDGELPSFEFQENRDLELEELTKRRRRVWQLLPVFVSEWSKWLDEQKKLSNVSSDSPVYMSLRMDGRVRGSGVGYPPWNAFVAQLPPVKGLWSGLLDGMDGRVL